MNRNIEIKASLTPAQFDSLRALALTWVGTAQVLNQEDTFFETHQGRLKLRTFGDGSGELIYYRRADEAGPKTSKFIRYESSDPSTLAAALTAAYPPAGVVRKRREVFLLDQTRIHLDEVQGLGKFLELEVVLQDDQTDQQGQQIMAQLMDRLKIDPSWLVSGAYVDLQAGELK